MEEQGEENRESKYRRLHYDGGSGGISSSEIREPPEGYRYAVLQKIQTDRGEKYVPFAVQGFPLVQPIPGYRKTIQPPQTSSEPSLEVMRYLYPDYDPSDPSAPVTPRNPKIPFKPLVFLDEDHKKFMLDLEADIIKKQAAREAEDKRRKDKSLDDLINRNLAKLFPASSGTKADLNPGESSSTMV